MSKTHTATTITDAMYSERVARLREIAERHGLPPLHPVRPRDEKGHFLPWKKRGQGSSDPQSLAT